MDDDSYSRAGNRADPPYLAADYRSTRVRAPWRPLIVIPQTLSEITGPVYGHADVRPEEDDLTRRHSGEPLGERIIVTGRVLDEDGRPVPDTLVEIWQATRPGATSTSSTSIPPRSTRTSRGPAAPRPMPTASMTSPRSSRALIPGATITMPGAPRISISPCSGRAFSRGW